MMKNEVMKQEEMNILIPEKLKEIEENYGVEILWAAEAGSRSWGFASPDSDFDVRFIYKRPFKEYLRLDHCRDVIELPINDIWDVNGWDLDKTLKLLSKSNPALYEWLNAPIIYKETGFRQRMEPLLSMCFSEKRMLHHYFNTARNDIKNHLQKETVKPKKYFYALRPVMACEWIMKYHSAPPVPFGDLVKTVLPDEMKPNIKRLLDLKTQAAEDTEIKQIQSINGYLSGEMEKIYGYLATMEDPEPVNWDRINAFFREEIKAGL